MALQSVLFVSLLSLAVAAVAFDIERIALYRRQAVPSTIPAACQSQCSAWSAACTAAENAKSPVSCFCGAAQQEFIACATCDPQVSQFANVTSPQQIAQEFSELCAMESGSSGDGVGIPGETGFGAGIPGETGVGVGVPGEVGGGVGAPSEVGGGVGGPTATSSSIESTPSGTGDGTCCEAWMSDLQPCQASGNYFSCTCTPAAMQDFLECVTCDPTVLADFNTTSPQAALTELQELCDSGDISGASLPVFGNSGAGSGSPSSSGSPGGNSGGLSDLPGGMNAASSVRPVVNNILGLVGVTFLASLF